MLQIQGKKKGNNGTIIAKVPSDELHSHPPSHNYFNFLRFFLVWSPSSATTYGWCITCFVLFCLMTFVSGVLERPLKTFNWLLLWVFVCPYHFIQFLNSIDGFALALLLLFALPSAYNQHTTRTTTTIDVALHAQLDFYRPHNAWIGLPYSLFLYVHTFLFSVVRASFVYG